MTTNDLGIATLQVGNESTFSNVDWSKLPLWISATVDGVSMGKTQIMTVPVAEHANHTGTLTKEILQGRWHEIGYAQYGFTFHSDGTATRHYSGSTASYRYYISGDLVILRDLEHNDQDYYHRNAIFYYSSQDNVLVGVMDGDRMTMRR